MESSKNNLITFFKYILVSVSSFIIDICLFKLFYLIIKKNIILATILARIISSIYNYLLNKDKVFNSKSKHSKTIYKYFILVIIQMFISAFLVDFIENHITFNVTLLKVIVDMVIFVINFLIQKLFIFAK